MGQRNQRSGKRRNFYPIDGINGAVGTQRLTNQTIAARAKVNPKSVGAVRNGAPVGVATLVRVLDVLGLQLRIEPKSPAVANGSDATAGATSHV